MKWLWAKFMWLLDFIYKSDDIEAADNAKLRAFYQSRDSVVKGLRDENYVIIREIRETENLRSTLVVAIRATASRKSIYEILKSVTITGGTINVAVDKNIEVVAERNWKND